jgi:ribonuclease HI
VWITLYTDASFHPKEGGGWACWLRSSLGRVVRQGVCPPEVRDNNLAEMHAIWMGITIGMETWAKAGIEGFHVKTDSTVAISVLKYGARPPRQHASKLYQERVRALLSPDIRIKLVWVKGHQSGDGVQAWLNNKVDSLSRDSRLKGSKTEGA